MKYREACDETASFLCPFKLHKWTKDFQITSYDLPMRRLFRSVDGLSNLFESLSQSLLIEKGHGKDCTKLKLKDKPRSS